MEYYSTVRRNEGLIYAMTWMNIVNIMLNKRSHRKDHILHDSIYMNVQLAYEHPIARDGSNSKVVPLGTHLYLHMCVEFFNFIFCLKKPNSILKCASSLALGKRPCRECPGPLLSWSRSAWPLLSRPSRPSTLQ